MSTASPATDLPQTPATIADEQIGVNGAIAVALTRSVGSMPALYAALAAYLAATVLWLWLLTRYSLAQAYPFTALAFLLVPLVETLVFRVRASRLYWLGLALIVIGAVLVGRAQVG